MIILLYSGDSVKPNTKILPFCKKPTASIFNVEKSNKKGKRQDSGLLFYE